MCSNCKFTGGLVILFFFFSSRRRHTRWTGDWSSDVCSSDLLCETRRVGACRARRRCPWWLCSCGARSRSARPSITRSEERRVGKECKYRGWLDHEKKKKSAERCAIVGCKSSKTLLAVAWASA